MIDQDKLEKMEARASNAALGYDTGGLPQHYARDVRLLMKERQELIDEVNRLTKLIADQPTDFESLNKPIT